MNEKERRGYRKVTTGMSDLRGSTSSKSAFVFGRVSNPAAYGVMSLGNLSEQTNSNAFIRGMNDK